MIEADPNTPTLVERIARLEKHVLFLQGAVVCAFNAMSPKERDAALDAMQLRGRPVGEGAEGYTQAQAMFGREVRR